MLTGTELNNILNSAIASIVCYRVYDNRDWEYAYQSAGSERLFGYTAEEIVADKALWQSCIFPEDWESKVSPIFDDISSELVRTIEYRFYHKNGSLRWISATYGAQRDQEANCWIVTGISTDINDRKAAETALAREALRVKTLLNTSFDGVVVIHQNQVVEANQRFAEMLGYTLEEITTLNVMDWETQWSLGELHETVDRWKHREGMRRIFETRHRRKDGSVFDVEISNNRMEWDGKFFDFCICRDISDRKRIEAERNHAETTLREAEERQRLILDLNQVGTWDWDLQSGDLTWNDQVFKLLGLNPKTDFASYQTFRNVIHPDDVAPFEACLSHALRSKIDYEIEYRVVLPNGSIRWLQAKAQSFYENDTPIRVLGILLDISDRKEAEIALQERDEILRKLSEQVPGFIYQYHQHPDGRAYFPYASEGIRDIYEVTPEQVKETAEGVFAVLHPADLGSVAEAIAQSARSLQLWQAQYRVILPLKGLRWLEGHAMPERLPDGSTLWHGYIWDISDRKTAEAALQKSEERYRQIVEIATEGIWMIDANSATTFVNPCITDMLGYRSEEMIGKSLFDFMDDEGREIAMRLVERRRQGITEQHDFKFQHKNGSDVWTMISTHPLMDEAGQYAGALGMLADITQRKAAENVLRQYERIVSATPDCVALIDRNYIYQVINQTYTVWNNKPHEKIVGHSVSELLGEEFFQTRSKPLLDRCLAGESNHVVESWLTYPDGKRRFVTAKYSPYIDLDGGVSGVVINVHDLTSLKQAEEALQHRTEREQGINRVFQVIRNSLDLDTIFATATAETANLLKIDRVQVMQYVPDRQCWRIVASYHPHLPDTVGLEIPEDCFECQQRELARVEYPNMPADGLFCGIPQVLAGTWLMQPLAIEGKVWGCLAVNSLQQPFHWDDEQTELVQSVADQLAIAIQQANLYHKVQLELAERQRAETALQVLNRDLERRVKERTEALKQQAEQERLLRFVTQRVHASLNYEEIINTVLTETRQTIYVDRVAIYRFDADWSGRFVAESVSEGWMPLVGPNIQTVWEDTYLQETQGGRYRNNETFAVNDIYTIGHTQCHVEILEQFQVKAYAIAPIFVRGNLWGLLAAYQNAQPRQWQNREIILIQQIAIRTAIAIQQSDLFQQVQTNLAVKGLLVEVAETINESLDLDCVSETCLKLIRQFLNCDRAIVCKLDDHGSGTIFKEDLSRSELSILGQVISDPYFSESCLDGYKQGGVIILNDLETDNIAPCYAEFLAQLQASANLAVPIFHVDKPWGLLLVNQMNSPRHWQPFEIEMLKWVALELGIASQKMELYTRLESELRQKEMLIKEVHHRVKNNLQVVSSLLNLQSASIEDPNILEPFLESQRRINVMAAIHERLYRSGNLASLNFAEYIQDLVEDVFQSYLPLNLDVQWQVEVANLDLELDIAIPCGLIVNELVSNAIKYAFPHRYAGKIDIMFTYENSRHRLAIGDNGIGFPETLDFRNTESLGMQIVCALTRQLGGTIALNREGGTTFVITF
ncbi:PAS domain S-box protein [Tumidithrix elongata RA019]|uniref:histidine kinase n=1 Tax=Tumidithrix elongata BACA0141 TaxID=2716417 RepID=A0AAW9PQJ8_9CYAN|nr:PAS domain S-box protein [Tumidithrix elongata RA019]